MGKRTLLPVRVVADGGLTGGWKGAGGVGGVEDGRLGWIGVGLSLSNDTVSTLPRMRPRNGLSYGR